ncbi:MAG TPA: hypothetical protein VJU60_07450 [Thermoleophilaceae bacterium]|nr:hypothetical protein [Thermoleophilaceae bacterium]
MQLFLVMLVLCGAAALMASPLYSKRRAGHGLDPEEAALEAARDAKFREIRDAELDFRTGKLSREDYRAIDASLRGEAIELLRRLDAVRGKEAAA